MFEALVKVGGSLYNTAELQNCVTEWAGLAASHRLFVVPGGGPFAAAVRAADHRFDLGDSAAHWMAILAMDQYAYLLTDLAPAAVLVHNLDTAATVCAAGRLPVLAPSTMLLKLDPLPHSWQITSDSIAAWLAGYANIELLVLLKSVEGVYQKHSSADLITVLPQVSKQTLATHDVVDACFSQVLLPTTTCWIIDGRRPERLAELLRCGSTVGTQIKE